MTTCTGIKTAEDTTLDRLIWTDPNNKKPGTERDYAERYKNIRRIVRGGAPEGGISNCN